MCSPPEHPEPLPARDGGDLGGPWVDHTSGVKNKSGGNIYLNDSRGVENKIPLKTICKLKKT